MASAAACRFLSRVSRLSSASPSILASRPIAPLSRTSRTSLLSSAPSLFRTQPVRLSHDEAPTGPKIEVPVTFIDADGHRWTVSALCGDTILQTADKHDIPLVGECAGGGWPRENYGEGPMCRTCMVYVDNAHVARVLPIEEDEEQILYWVDNATKNSRLACEVLITPELSGMTVMIPDMIPLRETEF